VKIVLADPPDVKSPWLIANHPNMGILYLAGYLRNKLKDVEIVYLDAFLSLEEHVNRLEELQPDVYGLSFSTMREEDAFRTIKAVRSRFKNMPIVCGGPYSTVSAETVVESLPVDACVRGEGEETMTELIEVFLGTRPLDSVDGIVFKRDGSVVSTPKRKFIRDLDSIPLPAWDMVNFSKYGGNYQYMARPSTVMIASRGCPFDCVFCANPVWKADKPWLRMRSPENICDEVSWLYEMGIREISIRSDEFNPIPDWPVRVCESIHELGLKDLYFQANMRADKVTKELVRTMKKANFWLVQLGIESGNQKTLDGIGKKITLEHVVQACELFQKYGIKVYGYVMIYHVWEKEGELCYETPEDVDRTLRFVRQLHKRRLLNYISFSTTTPMRGSRLYDIAERHRLFKPGLKVSDLSSFSMQLPDVSDREMKRSRRKGLLLQLSINLRSGNNYLTDWGKNWHKIKTLLRSV
jgi:radical SAM superfamily enzyme YgiQ (UPF0313 family)